MNIFENKLPRIVILITIEKMRNTDENLNHAYYAGMYNRLDNTIISYDHMI